MGLTHWLARPLPPSVGGERPKRREARRQGWRRPRWLPIVGEIIVGVLEGTLRWAAMTAVLAAVAVVVYVAVILAFTEPAPRLRTPAPRLQTPQAELAQFKRCRQVGSPAMMPPWASKLGICDGSEASPLRSSCCRSSDSGSSPWQTKWGSTINHLRGRAQ